MVYPVRNVHFYKIDSNYCIYSKKTKSVDRSVTLYIFIKLGTPSDISLIDWCKSEFFTDVHVF